MGAIEEGSGSSVCRHREGRELAAESIAPSIISDIVEAYESCRGRKGGREREKAISRAGLVQDGLGKSNETGEQKTAWKRSGFPFQASLHPLQRC